ncbi:MAG: hypothetical protein JWR51_4711 [Devosia sp.]|uniref:hypothetical protein n=1 Tax=Devosia sp. TaxID=1871048 RepID=UPI00263566A7|nr:hypothetical protein [Devosia sp.]MDB5531608.1 hypothetical protein [Devosia sp.]
MTRVPLLGGAYQSRSLIASASEAVNLYSERNAEDGQPTTPATSYPTPGLALVTAPPYPSNMRTLYRASNGSLYGVIGPTVYAISNTYDYTLLGTIPNDTSPVWFADNGQAIVLVDGSAVGYAIDMTTDAFGTITDPAFYGGTSASYQDTFFIFNRPGTDQFYISLSNVSYDMLTGTPGGVYVGSITTPGSGYVDATYTSVPLTGGTGSGALATITVLGGAVTAVTITDDGQDYTIGDVLSASNTNLGGSGSGFAYSVDGIHGSAFDPLDIAAKTGSADNIVAAPTVHGELWLIGELTTEVWYDAGAADFAYQRIQGAFVDHGCAAPYSIASVDISLLWLSQDRQGNCIVLMTEGYSVKRVSVHALEAEWQAYETIADAIGYVHQIEGHAFYVLTFPTADTTYCYDLSENQWHRRASIDGNGVLHRHRSSCFAFAYGLNLVGDYQNGNLYNLTNEAFTDNGVDIPRIRRFPHLIEDGKRVVYDGFQADMATGQITSGTTDDPPKVYLRWSDNRGFSFGNYVSQSMGGPGQYDVSMQWNRLGYARDRVFELSWSANTDTALQGCWVKVRPAIS